MGNTNSIPVTLTQGNQDGTGRIFIKTQVDDDIVAAPVPYLFDERPAYIELAPIGGDITVKFITRKSQVENTESTAILENEPSIVILDGQVVRWPSLPVVGILLSSTAITSWELMAW